MNIALVCEFNALDFDVSLSVSLESDIKAVVPDGRTSSFPSSAPVHHLHTRMHTGPKSLCLVPATMTP